MTTIREHLRALEELPGNTMLTAAEKLAFVEVRAQAALALLDQIEWHVRQIRSGLAGINTYDEEENEPTIDRIDGQAKAILDALGVRVTPNTETP